MTWIRKYILNRKVSYALCLYAVVLFFYITINYFKDFFIGLLFILPPLYYLAYVHYLNKKLGIWLKCFRAILLLGAVGSWIFLIFLLIEEGWLRYLDNWRLTAVKEEFFAMLYLLFLPLVFLEAYFGKSETKFKFSLSFLKFFLKKIVWVPIASIVSFAVVWTLILIVSIGGLQNFKERIGFDSHILYEKYSQGKYDVCTDTGIPLANLGEFNEFYLKEWIQFWDYFDVPQREALDRNDPKVLEESRKKAKSFLPFYKGDPKAQLQQAYLNSNADQKNINICEATRWLMRAAHQGDGMAQVLLSTDPYHYYTFEPDTHYRRNISNMDLNNPAVAYVYASFLDKRLAGAIWDWKNTEFDPEAIRYLEQSAEAGYLHAKKDLTEVYSLDKYFNKGNCIRLIKIYEYFNENNDITSNRILMQGYMGLPGTISQCLDRKQNLSKAFSYLTNMRNTKFYSEKHFFEEALFYLNGWSITQDYQKAFEIFSECKDKDNNDKCGSYLAFMTLRGLGTTKDEELGKDIFLSHISIGQTYVSSIGEYLNITPSDNEKLRDVLCGNETIYNFINKYESSSNDPPALKAQVIQCIKDADRETLLAIVEAHIRNQLMEFYKNEELLATLNVMGEPQ